MTLSALVTTYYDALASACLRAASSPYEFAQGLKDVPLAIKFKIFFDPLMGSDLRRALDVAVMFHGRNVAAWTTIPDYQASPPWKYPAAAITEVLWRLSSRWASTGAEYAHAGGFRTPSSLNPVLVPTVGATPPSETLSADAKKRQVAERASKRQAVVNPILKRKRRTRGRLATDAGVSKNTVYQYLDGTRGKIEDENRQAIAEALDLEPDQLPD